MDMGPFHLRRPQVPYHAGNKTYPVNSAKASVGVRILVMDIACPPPHSLSKMIWDTSTCGHSCSTNSEALAGWGQSMLAATKVLSLEYWKRKTREKVWPLESIKSGPWELLRRAERAQSGGYFLKTQNFFEEVIVLDYEHFYVIGTKNDVVFSDSWLSLFYFEKYF